MSLRRIRLRDDLIPVDLHVLVGDFDAAQAWVARRFPPDGWGEKRGAGKAAVIKSVEGVGHECVIWLPYFRRGNAFDASTLAHEALHIVWRLLEVLGIFDEETHCYMLQWIVNEATCRINGKP